MENGQKLSPKTKKRKRITRWTPLFCTRQTLYKLSLLWFLKHIQKILLGGKKKEISKIREIKISSILFNLRYSISRYVNGDPE